MKYNRLLTCRSFVLASALALPLALSACKQGEQKPPAEPAGSPPNNVTQTPAAHSGGGMTAPANAPPNEMPKEIPKETPKVPASAPDGSNKPPK